MKKLIFVLMFLTTQAFGDSIYMFGDSVFALNGVVKTELEDLSGRPVTSHATTGATMKEIFLQYTAARNEEIDLVVMNGGGNDILDNMVNCLRFNDHCRMAIHEALSVMEYTLNTLADDGVETVVWVGYYKPVRFMLPLRRALEYAWPLMAEVCANSPVRCVMVDPRIIFSEIKGVIKLDGVHPTEKGSKIIAEQIWETLDRDVFGG